MKTLRIMLLFIVFPVIFAGCDRTIYDTNRGNMSVSFKIDGERYMCDKKNVHMESPMRLSFYDDKFLDFHVDAYQVDDNTRKGCLRFTISDTEKIVTGKKYYLNYYSGEQEDRVAEPPVFFAEFDDYRSITGWVKLRKIKKYKERDGYKVISGNFEFSARRLNGESIDIKDGTFDGIY